MPGLLTPAFLAGLAVLAVPLLVHLIRRARHDAVEFPSLMFVRQIPQRTVKHRRIRNWPLLLLRSLLLLLLVGAFARPFVERAPDALAVGDVAGEVVILLDRSYSMGYGDRWQRAVSAAREAVDGLGQHDRATLILFDGGAHTAVTATTDRARLRQALDAARPGAGVTRYTPALKLAESVLAGSDLARLEAVLISDFQRAGWEGAAGVQFPAGAQLRPMLIGGDDVANLVVTGATLERGRVSGRERVTVTAHIANRGNRAARNVPVTLETDGRTAQSLRADVEANDVATITLQPLTLGDAAMPATLRAGTDALPIDNTFHFVLAPDGGMRVLLVEADGRDRSLYLRRALELAQDPPVEVAVRRSGMPTAAELERTDVVVLNDVLPQDGDAARRLLEWANAGGGIILAMGDRTAAATWGGVARSIAGGVPGRLEDRIGDGGARLGFVDYSHPVFEPFRAPRAGAFGAARFYRLRAVPAADARRTGSDSAAVRATVLARFDDGTAALVERQLGDGRALVWGSTLDADWTNIPLGPSFLPLVHQMVRRAAGFAPARPWSTAGQIVDVGRAGARGGGGDAALVVVAPDGDRTDVARNTLLRFEQPGFYEVREARAGAGTLALHAVNVDVSESELAALDPREVASAVTRPAGTQREAGMLTLPREEQERRQSLWWYLLIAAFVLMAAEAVLANRRSARPA